MSFRLVAEVLDHAPRDLGPTERLVLVALAELAREHNRECDCPMATLSHRVGVTPQGVRLTMARLARRGLDLRVSLGIAIDGRPVYAYRGHVPTYRIPEFQAPKGCLCQACREAEGSGRRAPSRGRGTKEGATTHAPSRAKKGDSRRTASRSRVDSRNESGAVQKAQAGQRKGQPGHRKGQAQHAKGASGVAPIRPGDPNGSLPDRARTSASSPGGSSLPSREGGATHDDVQETARVLMECVFTAKPGVAFRYPDLRAYLATRGRADLANPALDQLLRTGQVTEMDTHGHPGYVLNRSQTGAAA